jgi:hypothetical protein
VHCDHRRAGLAGSDDRQHPAFREMSHRPVRSDPVVVAVCPL